MNTRRFACASCLLGLLACGSDATDTFTEAVVDVDKSLERAASLSVTIFDSEGAIHDRPAPYSRWPQRFAMRPRHGDASRRFRVRAEVFDGADLPLGSLELTTGFVAGQTRYVSMLVNACQDDDNATTVEPGQLARSEPVTGGPGVITCRPLNKIPTPAKPEAGRAGGAAGAQARAGTGGAGVHAGAGGAAGPEKNSGKDKHPSDIDAGPGEAGRDAAAAGMGGHDMGGAAANGGSAAAGASGSAGADVCGDGRKSGSELCDPAIEAGNPGACPMACDAARDSCTHVQLIGAACLTQCESTKITQAIRDDGCCPPGESANSDNDCVASCGNGVIEPGETCDPPQSCAADTICKVVGTCLTAVVTGDPSKCNARCDAKPISDCRTGDNCCPSGCTSSSDGDCPSRCGDGVVDSGETCEAGSATPCPSQASCDDADPCTKDVLTGSAQTCTAACTHTPIKAPSSSDGCCPSGANAKNDNDCQPMCNNGVVEGNEQCDGMCPSNDAACADKDPCTTDTLVGTACQRRCQHTPITTASQAADGCCPSGATRTTDVDCPEVNLLSGKVFSSTLPAVSGMPAHPVSYITDGNDNTRWISTAASPVTLTVDLGATYTLKHIDIIWAGDTIEHFLLQVSSDNQMWTTIVQGTTNNSPREVEEYTKFTNTPTGRYFQIVGVDRWDATYGNSIWEVKLYASAPSP